jgi:hypothetical protein
MDNQKKLAAFFRALANRLENSSLEELEKLLKTKDHPRKSDRKPTYAIPNSQLDTSRDWAQVADELRDMSTRDDGREFLEKLAFTRAELERLARVMNLPVSKQDNAERLKEKIVEFGIGSRLDSQAIRGK